MDKPMPKNHPRGKRSPGHIGPPTLHDIDELLKFRPLFEGKRDGFVKRWGGGPQKDGSIQWPFPVYEPHVVAFFREAGKPAWIDKEYLEANVHELVRDGSYIRKASLSRLRTVLTWCTRGERFCDGHWEQVLKKGYVEAILKRLAALRNGFGARPEKKKTMREAMQNAYLVGLIPDSDLAEYGQEHLLDETSTKISRSETKREHSAKLATPPMPNPRGRKRGR